MKKKLSVRAAASLLLSALLFCMPIGALMANSGNTVDAYAEESSTGGETEESTGTEGSGEAEESTETEPGDSGGESEGETEGGTVSGNEIPKPECTCKEKCIQYSYDKDCEVCKEDYTQCEYVNPKKNGKLKSNFGPGPMPSQERRPPPMGNQKFRKLFVRATAALLALLLVATLFSVLVFR